MILSIAGTTALFAQTGAIAGSATTADGTPAEFVNVFLPELNRGTSTDRKGKYKLSDVPAGTYVVAVSAVGIDRQERRVTVVAGETVEVGFELEETAQELAEIVITSTQSYTRAPSATVQRMEVRALENPQSTQVINQALLEDRQVQSVGEATRLMAGVNTFSSAQYSDYALRGFRAGPGNFAYNGLRTDLYQFDQAALTYNIEAIEVIRGPASVLFSSGNPGGVINHVTK